MYYYDQIIEKEKYWSSLMEKGLLNVYYLKCSNGVKDFYLSKIRELNGYLYSDPSDEIKKIINRLNNIIKKIEIIIAKHDNGEDVDINELSNYFLINLAGNDNEEDIDINVDEIKSEVYKALSNYYGMPKMENISTN